MLVSDFAAYCIADDYAEFAGKLRWYRMYCATQAGNSRSDYKKGFESLKDAYAGIFQYGKDEPPVWIERSIKPYFNEIEEILSKTKLSKSSIDRISTLLFEIEKQEASGDKTFRDKCLDFRLEQELKIDYSPELYEAVYKSFMAEDYDAAVLAAFKHLDAFLQKLLNISPHEYYGEALINYAFAPNQGIIQLKTHPNEQVGLRNLVSGALAIFRNPSAHRFMKYDQFTASTVIALIATIIKLTNEIMKAPSG